MKISNIINIQKSYIAKSCAKKINSAQVDETDKANEYKPKNDRTLFNMSEEEPYKTVYNNATLKNSSNKLNNEISDEEINKEINLRIYKENHLDELGIEFNSDEFKGWLEENKNTFPVPLDAPAKLRKQVYNMLDSAKDPAKYFLLRDFTRGFKKVNNHSDLSSYMKETNDILKSNNDYLKLVKMNNTGNPVIKKSIDDFTKIVSEILTFKNNLKDIIDEDK